MLDLPAFAGADDAVSQPTARRFRLLSELELIRGMLDVLDPDAELTAFVPHDSDEAGCLTELRGLTGPLVAK